MTPGVMTDPVSNTRNEATIKSDPSLNNISSTKLGKQKEAYAENGVRIKREEATSRGEDESALDMAILAPALPHVTQGFYPLSRLINRLVQESYIKLVELIEAFPDQPEMKRRINLMEYVMERRQQFIKLLVIAGWARRADEVSRAIDVKIYFDQVERYFVQATWELFGLRRDLANAKVPNPDLETAIEVLSTGKALSVPTYKYIQPPPSTPQEIKKFLRNINTLLSIRLNLYDNLPEHFRDYRIGDGRATFRVQHEFEVDLTIIDEDPAAQLWLVDFRLTFEPALKILPDDRFRAQIEAIANDKLKTNGLKGLYDFFHDWVMSHKILTLYRQVREMIAGRWLDTLSVNMHKKTLIVHYWNDRYETKSWIEVGIKRPRGKLPSRLSVRWHREGAEVKDQEVPINIAVVSAEELIKTVIALHTKHILTTIRNKLVPLPIFTPSSLELKTSDSDSFGSLLKVRLTGSKTITILIEPITGRFAIQKPSLLHSSAEASMNWVKSSSAPTLVEFIQRLRFVSQQEEIEQRGRSMGWEIMKILNIQKDELKRYFGVTTKYLIFMRRKEWRKQWVVVVSLGDTGDAWWVAEIYEASQGHTMSDVQRINIQKSPNVTYQFWSNLETMASAMITHYVNSRALTARNVQFALKPPIANDNAVRIPDMMIRFDHLMKQNWGTNVLRFTFHELSSNGHATIVVLGRAKEPMTQLNSQDLTSSDTDVAFYPRTGSFALRFVVPVGDDVIDAMIERLQRIERLIGFVSVIRRYKLACHHVSLGRIAFRYGREPNATAEVSFAGDKDMQLHLPELSPHIRIRHFLEQALNDRGLDIVVISLSISQHILSAFEEIERTTPEGELFILSRTTEWYRMDYPKRGHVIDIQLKARKSQLWWHIRDAALNALGMDRPNAGGYRQPASVLTEFWFDPGIKGTCGLKTGIAADLAAVGQAVKKIHNAILPSAAVALSDNADNGIPVNAAQATLVLPRSGN